MENLHIYNALRTPPKEALKEIKGGRMNGKTDINPMWRLKALTEQFGPCGVGWKYEITRQWLEAGADGEVSAFCNILLFYKLDGQWSEGIPGTGGSAFVAKERGGLYTSDECYKMALTDALSVACKALGVAADVYWQSDPTKYGRPPAGRPEAQKGPVCADCGKPIKNIQLDSGKRRTAQQIADYALNQYGRILCPWCQKKEREAGQAAG